MWCIYAEKRNKRKFALLDEVEEEGWEGSHCSAVRLVPPLQSHPTPTIITYSI